MAIRDQLYCEDVSITAGRISCSGTDKFLTAAPPPLPIQTRITPTHTNYSWSTATVPICFYCSFSVTFFSHYPTHTHTLTPVHYLSLAIFCSVSLSLLVLPPPPPTHSVHLHTQSNTSNNHMEIISNTVKHWDFSYLCLFMRNFNRPASTRFKKNNQKNLLIDYL